jgi:mono/diheme cytochrome c family protein
MKKEASDNKHFLRSFFSAFIAVVLIAGLSVAASESGWEKKVPDADRSRPNPEANDPNAAVEGKKLYAENCAKCHGENAEGKGHAPSLRTPSVQQATPGELEWLILHGKKWHGMPAMPGFGKLTETQRWQLVTYIKSLPAETK